MSMIRYTTYWQLSQYCGHIGCSHCDNTPLTSLSHPIPFPIPFQHLRHIAIPSVDHPSLPSPPLTRTLTGSAHAYARSSRACTRTGEACVGGCERSQHRAGVPIRARPRVAAPLGGGGGVIFLPPGLLHVRILDYVHKPMLNIALERLSRRYSPAMCQQNCCKVLF